MSEFQVTDQGQLDLGIDDAVSARPSAAESPRFRSAHATDATSIPEHEWLGPEWPEDAWVDQGWVPGDYGDPETDPDDYEAWLAGLPADVRAEFLDGAWTGAGDAIPAGFLHHLHSGPVGVGFAAGGVLDTLAPGPWLADAIAAATGDGHAKLGESELIGALCAWRRISSWAAAGEAAAVITLARRRSAQSREPGMSHLDEHVEDEIAAAMTLTGRSAARLLTVASGLARLEAVLAALRLGKIDWAKATQFVDELAVLEGDALAAGIAARLLGRARRWRVELRAAAGRVAPRCASRRPAGRGPPAAGSAQGRRSAGVGRAVGQRWACWTGAAAC